MLAFTQTKYILNFNAYLQWIYLVHSASDSKANALWVTLSPALCLWVNVWMSDFKNAVQSPHLKTEWKNLELSPVLNKEFQNLTEKQELSSKTDIM